ncbi:MAG: peptide-methionine (S)-S-oxide reductase MsrA [Lactobacillus kefiranofaciens]|nr:peptide methionine sulfoxide reductase MsrA [Lactobacillus kefiranofaciens subsp. kefirgranum DSM 10550 = JCM 8572]KRM23093.1 peptide methionine sulfoxide reductase MsrA [Lactobacillus kefiranofaciens subsp. kefiranofaciens DSM 5016 = JCM 6985]
MEDLPRMTENNKQVKAIDTKAKAQYDTAIFAGGCFWCMVEPFDTVDGVEKVISGYTGGHVANPTYQEVCTGKTGHTEAVEIIYDPNKISYEKLLDYYWQVTDPTDAMGQFQDRGDNYRPVIFYNSEAQKKAAEKSKADLANSGRFDQPIVTKIEKAQPFYPAEEYHQEFYKKDPARYALEEAGGRTDFIKKHWKK